MADDGHYTYALYAVSKPFWSNGFGHYTAYASSYPFKASIDKANEEWQDFDDATVSGSFSRSSKVKSSSVASYFYQRREVSREVNFLVVQYF